MAKEFAMSNRPQYRVEGERAAKVRRERTQRANAALHHVDYGRPVELSTPIKRSFHDIIDAHRAGKRNRI